MLAVYSAITLYDTDAKWKYFKRKLDRAPMKSGLSKFGDVDFWFEDGHEIYNGTHDSQFLIKELDESGLNISSNKLGLTSIQKTSKWANTFGVKNNFAGVGSYQFIKSKPKNPQELLQSFDFINSMVGWKDGVLYFDDRIDSAFENLQLQVNNDKAYKKSIASRVFNALRAFKYSTRFSLDFDDVLCEHIFKVYSDIGDIDYDAYGDKVIELENLYGKTVSSVKTLRDMVSSLNFKFKDFAKMDTFKPEYALFLVGRSDIIPGVKEYIATNGNIDAAQSVSVSGSSFIFSGISAI